MILFLGMVRRGEYETFLRRGLSVGVLVDTHTEHRLADVSGFVFIDRFDFSRTLPELIERVRSIHEQQHIDCLFNVMEMYVTIAAAVASALGLPGISASAANLCRDKVAMRRRFQQRIGPESCARFEAVDSETELLRVADAWGYPVFLQPSDVASSMWATRSLDQQALLANYRTMVGSVPAYYQQLGKSEAQLTVVCAEYLAGANTSIDCVADASGRVYATPIVDVLTGQDVGIDDFHHFARFLPSRLEHAVQADLERLAVAGVRALDMTNCAAHVEFIGMKLGEIAARPGGNRPRILELAYGIDELHAYYQVLRGKAPRLEPSHAKAVGIVTPYPPRGGVLRSINQVERIRHLATYLYHEVRAQPGQRVGLSKNGHRSPLYVELQFDDADAVRRDAAEIASWVDLYTVE